MIASLILTYCAAICEAQDIRIVERLSDGSFIVTIEGFGEYRAINADKVREIQKLRIDLEAAERIASESQIQIKEALLQRDLAQAQRDLQGSKVDSLQADFNRAREDAARNFSLFQSERALRVEAQSFVPKGNASGFWGKMLDALNSQPGQLAFKIGLPMLNTIRCQR